ncbi:MAG TPA: SRPBCC family protein [Bacteroidia bacterium]|nr:SRPBCC family protein [Bacteroidia bacterium]
MLKKIVIVVLSLILLLVVASLFMPRNAYVERSRLIKAPSDIVFNQVNILKNWEKWSPWHRLDPHMQMTYSGPEAGAGAAYAWKSTQKNVGNGKLTVNSSNTDSILTTIEFEGKGNSDAGFRFKKEGNDTRVTWFMKFDMGMSPIAKIFGLMMDKMIGPDFEKGLNSLDSVSVAAMKNPPGQAEYSKLSGKTYKVETTVVEAMQIMSAKGTCTPDQIGPTLGKLYGEIGAAMRKQKIKQAGPVMAIYNVYTPEKVELEAAVPCSAKGKADGNVIAREMPKSNVLMVDYYGPYDIGMKAAHDQIHEYAKAQGKEISGAPWEVYVSDPMTEKDPSKLLTKIYYPVK